MPQLRKTQLNAWSPLVAILLYSKSLPADDDLVIGNDSPPVQPQIVEGQRMMVLQRIRVRNFAPIAIASNEEFERQIFGRDVSAQRGRWRINADLISAITRIDHTCALTRAQQEKLELAGRIDRKRFFDRVEAARQRSRVDGANLEELEREVEELRAMAEAGILGPRSFFAKSARTVLRPDQLELCQQPHQLALIEKTVSEIESKVNFQPSHRQALVKQLQRELPDIAVFWAAERHYANEEMKEMQRQLGLLAEDKLKPQLSDGQWNELQAFINHVEPVEQVKWMNVRVNNIRMIEQKKIEIDAGHVQKP